VAPAEAVEALAALRRERRRHRRDAARARRRRRDAEAGAPVGGDADDQVAPAVGRAHHDPHATAGPACAARRADGVRDALAAGEEHVAGKERAVPLRALLAADLEGQRRVDRVVALALERERLGIARRRQPPRAVRPPGDRAQHGAPVPSRNVMLNGLGRMTTLPSAPSVTVMRSSPMLTAAEALVGASASRTAMADSDPADLMRRR
jgi:hypothetical protein